jgi:hypothetical protein
MASCLCWELWAMAVYWVRKEATMKLHAAPVPYDEAFDSLVEAGYRIVGSDFDETTFKNWRQKAIASLSAMLGRDHVYCRYFTDFVRQGGRWGLLAASGIMSAAKEQASSEWHGSVKTIAT